MIEYVSRVTRRSSQIHLRGKRRICKTNSGVKLKTKICYMSILITEDARQSNEPPPLLTVQGYQ